MPSYTDSSALAGPSKYPTIIGVWSKASSTIPVGPDIVDIEARLEDSPNFSLPMRPPTTYTTYSESSRVWNAFHQFRSAGALEAHRSTHATLSSPPPYSPGDCIYSVTGRQTPDTEHPTLARMLFMYGFLCFPFWLAGIYILCSPLLSTEEWESGKTEAEKAYLIQVLRKTELKWARRCLLATFGLFALVFFLVVLVRYAATRVF